MRKFLFLDIDGVLNSQDWMLGDKAQELRTLAIANKTRNNKFHFDPAAIELLTEIVLATGCEIVISSSWRKNRTIEQLQQIFTEVGFEHSHKIIGKTDSSYNWLKPGVHCPSIRGLEIKVWLDLNVRKTESGFTNNNFTYCILDDDIDMLYEQNWQFIHTDPQTGLSSYNVNRAIDILNDED